MPCAISANDWSKRSEHKHAMNALNYAISSSNDMLTQDEGVSSGSQNDSASDISFLHLRGSVSSLRSRNASLLPVGLPSSAHTSGAEFAHAEDNAHPTVDSSDGSEPDDRKDLPLTVRPLSVLRSQSQIPTHTTSTLFPPFYNRPPVPLPPSPSLTSLLRPSFSTSTSRPTTPDSSDVDLAGASTNTNLASITKSARYAPLVPRASPKVPTYEYYGFALYLASSAAFLLYLVWAYVPSPLLHQMGIHYYPNRWWALAVPCWLVVLVVYIYVALASYNTRYLTLPLSSCENLVDETAQIAVIDRRSRTIMRSHAVKSDSQDTKEKTEKASGTRGPKDSLPPHCFSPSEETDWKSWWSISTDAVLDVPIGGVCEILYADED